MNDQREIPIADLLKISKKLIDANFGSHDFYSLLVLAMATVNEYSRSQRRINSKTRIYLSIAFIPDLIQYLSDTHVISKADMEDLKESYREKLPELSTIMRAYCQAAVTLHPKTPPVVKKTSWPCSIA